jgi:serine/threonine-protein kinase
VKLLDYGLAKALDENEGEMGSDSLTALRNSPVSHGLTGAGVLLGTVGYMSPEQARGHAVDRRTDVWAFGCVLHEMLSGKRTFPGDTVTDVLASIVNKEPDLDALPALPQPVRRLLELCLRKDATRRLQSIGDARIALQDYLDAPASEPSATAPSASRSKGILLAAGAAAISALAAWMAASFVGSGARPEPLRRLDVRMGDKAFDLSLGSSVVVSSNGTFLAYVTGTAGGESQLFLRPLDRSEGIEMVKGVGAALAPYHPFFSHDEKWLGYVTASELKKISVTGGTPMTLAKLERSRGASWSEDGVIVYSPSPGSGLFTIPEGGGTPEPLTTLDPANGEATHRWPQWLPGARAVLFTTASSSTNLADASLEVVIRETGERKVIHRGGYYGRYVESGHVLYAFQNTLFALPFDLNRLEAKGAPVPVVPDVAGASAEGTAHFDVSSTGLLTYLTGEGPAETSRLVWVDANGRSQDLWAEPGVYGNPHLSPDGSRLSLTVLRDNNWDVWVYDLNRTVATRLTFGDGYDADQVWSPDGRHLAYSSDYEGRVAIFRKRADGTGDAELVGQAPQSSDWFPTSWSKDGRFLLAQSTANGNDIWIIPMEKDEEPRALLATPFSEGFAEFSPDGRFFAYESNESGRQEVYVRSFPEGDGKWQLSDGGGSQPRFSADGRKLFYRTDDGVVAVDVETTSGGFVAGRSQKLFEGPFHGGLQGIVAAGFVFPDYAADAAGTRFVMLAGKAEDISAESWLTLVTGWFPELETLAPTKR